MCRNCDSACVRACLSVSPSFSLSLSLSVCGVCVCVCGVRVCAAVVVRVWREESKGERESTVYFRYCRRVQKVGGSLQLFGGCSQRPREDKA